MSIQPAIVPPLMAFTHQSKRAFTDHSKTCEVYLLRLGMNEAGEKGSHGGTLSASTPHICYEVCTSCVCFCEVPFMISCDKKISGSESGLVKSSNAHCPEDCKDCGRPLDSACPHNVHMSDLGALGYGLCCLNAVVMISLQLAKLQMESHHGCGDWVTLVPERSKAICASYLLENGRQWHGWPSMDNGSRSIANSDTFLPKD